MKAIVVKYLPATDYKGSRVKAVAQGTKPLTICYNCAESDPFRVVAESLRDREGWKGDLIEGGLPSGERVFVFDRK